MSAEFWDVFISYRRKDGAAVARWVRARLLRFRLPKDVLERLDDSSAALHKRGPRVWLDTAYERPSDDFLMKKVFPALDSTGRLIVISTPAALEPLQSATGPQPNWLVREIDHFVSRNDALTIQRPIDVVLGPGAAEDRFPGPLGGKPRIDWIDLRAFKRYRWNPLDESLDVAVAKLIAGLYSVPDRDLPVLQRAERRQRAFWLIVGLVVAVLTAVLMLLLAGYAESQRRVAAEQRDLAVARLLASEGYRVAQSVPDRAKVYFLSSIALAETPNAISGLTSLVQQDPHASMKFLALDSQPTAFHARDDDRVAVGLPDGSILLWSIGSPEAAAGERALVSQPETRRLPGLGAPLIALAQPQDRVLAIDDRGRLIEWMGSGSSPKVVQALISGDEIARRSFDNTLEAAIAEDGNAAAIPTYRGIAVWTQRRGAFRFVRPELAAGGPVALSADGRKLAYPIGGGLSLKIPMRITDLRDDRLLDVDLPPLPSAAGAVLAAAFARDSATLAVGTQNGFVQVWRVAGTPKEIRLLQHRVVPQSGAHEVVEHVYLEPSGKVLVSRYAGGWQIWDIASGTPLGAPRESRTPVAAYAGARHSLLTVIDETIVVHDHGIDHLRYVACMSAPAELSIQEWKDVAGDAPRVRACGS